MNNIATIPNMISFSRLLAGLAFIPLNNLFNFSNAEIFIIILIAWFSDLMDGWVARKMNQISDFGKYIDPFADKIFVFALIITFYLSAKVNLFYLLLVIGRDLLILAGGIFISRKYKLVLPSNLLGKLCVFSIGAYFLLVLAETNYAAIIVKWISIILIFGSLIIYYLRAYEFIKDLNYVHKKD
jgi:CDP-diacylglycerol--glycerol-3-phosphate 3-phosphatidyltransferase